MIIIFHCFANFIYELYKNIVGDKKFDYKKFTVSKLNLKNFHPLAVRDAECCIKFDPPVYKQRYERTSEVLLEEKWKDSIRKVVDFGCAEFGLFIFLKNTLKLNEICLVDIDESLLREHLYRTDPLIAEHISVRSEKLTVKVFIGSICKPETHLRDFDAVIALEIIEHLYPDVLDAFPYNIFSYIQPKLVIVTTPNYEFNVLFEKLKTFRHPDHKFEWTRNQFEDWATNITHRFPNYIVRFDGIGHGPRGTEHLGFCSQLAVFIRKDIICDTYENRVTCVCMNSTCKLRNTETSSTWCSCNCRDCLPKYSYDSDQSNYKLIASVDYPFFVDERTEEEKILDEINYIMFTFGHINGQYFNFVDNRAEIPVSKLLYGKLQQYFSSTTELRNFLRKFNFKVEECLNQETKQTESCLIYEPEMEPSDGSGSNTDASGYESDNNQRDNCDDQPLSDWDSTTPPIGPAWTPEPTQDVDVLVVSEGPKHQLHLEVGGSKNKQGALFDSGYQKSPPSVTDESPPPPPPMPPPSFPLPTLPAKSVKQLLRSPNEKPQKLSNILSVFDNFDKINELDTVRRDKNFLNIATNLPRKEVMKKLCQEIAKHPVAGPSRDPKEKSPKRSNSSDSDESVDEVKSIATCLLENTLNKIECKDEEQQQMGHLIQEIEQVAAQQENIPEPVLVVENGDLANNNRDLEGNNYPPEENFEDAEDLQNADDVIDNMEPNNVNIDNNNEFHEEDPGHVIEEAPQQIQVIEEEPEVEWPSREAICDGNSHVDLLDDFDMDIHAINGIVFPNDCIIVPGNNSSDPPAALPPDNGFPSWLLQIFQDVEPPAADDEHDEPHFYCQGDGLGVHPSTVALNDDDEEDDEGNESGSDSSSNSGSASFSNAQNSTSVQELFMTPEGSRNDENFVVVGQQLEVEAPNVHLDSSENDIFENAHDSESNLSVAN